MARNRTNAATAIPAADLDFDKALQSCGSSPEALRAWVLAYRRSARWALDAQLYRLLCDRGYDARELCARELSARLSDVTVCELLQTISMGRKDAVIDVFHGPLASRIWCSGGEIVDAASGRLTGESAVYRILALDHGELVVDFRPVQRPRQLRSSTQQLMLEALRRKDECAVLEKRLGGSQRVYSSVADAPLGADARDLEAAVLDAFKTGARIDSVLAGSALDDLAMLQAMSELVERGSLVAKDATPALVPRPAPAKEKMSPNRAMPPLVPMLLRVLSWPVAAVLAAFAAGVVLIAWILRPASEPEVAVHTTEMPAGDADATDTAERRPAVAPGLPSIDSSPPPEPSTNTAEAHATTYPVQVTVEPDEAELWLDGTWIATGQLSVVLGRNGRTHELRIVAPEHRPQTFLFRDTSPPRAVRLEPADDVEGEGSLESAPSSAPQRHSRAAPTVRRATSALSLLRATSSHSDTP